VGTCWEIVQTNCKDGHAVESVEMKTPCWWILALYCDCTLYFIAARIIL